MTPITDEHRAKAKEISSMIKSSSPEVLMLLSDFCGLDDGEPMLHQHPDDALQDMFDCNGYPENKKEIKQTIRLGMCLPDIEIDVKFDEESDERYTWDFSKS